MNVSSFLHGLIWSDVTQSLCARAWDQKDDSRFWRAFVAVLGPGHCKASWDYWHE